MADNPFESPRTIDSSTVQLKRKSIEDLKYTAVHQKIAGVFVDWPSCRIVFAYRKNERIVIAFLARKNAFAPVRIFHKIESDINTI